jgi:hypothetical protein
MNPRKYSSNAERQAAYRLRRHAKGHKCCRFVYIGEEGSGTIYTPEGREEVEIPCRNPGTAYGTNPHAADGGTPD